MSLAIGVMAVGAALATVPQPAVPPHVHPEPAPAACPAVAPPLPPDLMGWSRTMPVAAGASVARAPRLALAAGADAALLPMARIAFPVAPAKVGGPAGTGGLFTFMAPAAGRYRVALGSAAWVDLVLDGRPIVSAGHMHGPPCSGIRKIVDFDLRPGTHVIQISGGAEPDLRLMVAPAR